MVILAFDGLEYEYVKEFNCRSLMQESFGKTDISEFTEPRTVVIWSSFLAGKNLEKKILSLGKENLWKFELKPEETFFSKFKKWKAIDVPGFSYKKENHERERKALKDFFNEKISVEEYDEIVFENHKENKEEFFDLIDEDYQIIMAYFNLADAIGHLSFGIKPKMKLIYKELEDITTRTKKKAEKILVISDHGMKAVGRFGDHSNYGFWSLNFKIDLKTPKITEMRNLIEELQD